MEFLSNPVIALLVVIGILVTVHEAGHFLVGRFCGIAVETFSVGFGPSIFKTTRGMTTYKIALLPFGGYVKFYGMLPNETVPEGVTGTRFYEATYWQRVATLAAGPIANLILAVFVYMALGMSGIPHPQAIVGEIQEGSAAEKAGLKFQDQIVEIDGKKIRTWLEMRDIISASAGKTLNLTFLRDGEKRATSLMPDEADGEDIIGRKQKIGRAGVSRGAIPAIVAVKPGENAAFKAGLVTGMRIVSINVGNEVKAISYWQEFLRYVSDAQAQGQASMDLMVAPTHKDGTANKAESKQVSLSLAALTCQECATEAPKNLAERLGLLDAQLVVADWQELKNQGLQKNDLIIAWNAEPLSNLHEYLEKQQDNKQPKVALSLVRDNKAMELTIDLKAVERQLPSGKEEIFILPITTLGMPAEPEAWVEKYTNPFEALYFGMKETGRQAAMVTKVVGLLFVGELPLKALGGPIMIANAAGEAAQAGWQVFVGTLAIISINLAVFNAIPLPLFDGGQIVLASVEAIRRRRLSEAAQENFQRLGFAVLMALIVLATHNDLTRYWAAMVKRVTGVLE